MNQPQTYEGHQARIHNKYNTASTDPTSVLSHLQSYWIFFFIKQTFRISLKFMRLPKHHLWLFRIKKKSKNFLSYICKTLYTHYFIYNEVFSLFNMKTVLVLVSSPSKELTPTEIYFSKKCYGGILRPIWHLLTNPIFNRYANYWQAR